MGTFHRAITSLPTFKVRAANSSRSAGALKPLTGALTFIFSPTGFDHFSGILSFPPIIPKMAPRVAPVQSVSYPQLTAFRIASPKFSP